MNLKNIRVVYKKERTDMLRDRRTVFNMLVFPLIMFPIISIGFSRMESTFREKAKKEAAQIMVLGAAHAPEAAELISGFLEKSQASLGSSKSLVDLSGEGQAVLPFLTHLHQVGQTGSTPRHRKGLATCCHGEEPHVVGWRFINERRAVNLDPNCGWARGKADVLYVADAFAVMARVNELLS